MSRRGSLPRAAAAALALMGCELVAGIQDRTIADFDGGTGGPDGAGSTVTFSLADLEGTWTGRIGSSSTVRMQVDATGRATGSGFSGTWRIDDSGRVTGSGSVAALSGTSLIVASATWRLTMSADKQTLTGTVDGSAPGLHDLAVRLTRSEAGPAGGSGGAGTFGSGGRSGAGGSGGRPGTGGTGAVIIVGTGGRTGGSGGATGGTVTCVRPSAPLLTDFSTFDNTTGMWGMTTGVWGLLLGFPTGFTVTAGDGAAHVTGSVTTYSGFLMAFASMCVDASAYSGISFTIGGNVGASGTVTLLVGTRSDTPVDSSGLGTCQYASEATKYTDCLTPQRVITVPAAPGPVRLAWADFSGGKPVAAVEPQGITSVLWMFSWQEGNAPYPVSVSLDDVGFW